MTPHPPTRPSSRFPTPRPERPSPRPEPVSGDAGARREPLAPADEPPPPVAPASRPPSRLVRVLFVVAFVAAVVASWLALSELLDQPRQPGGIDVIWPLF